MDNLQGRPHYQSVRESLWGQEFFDPLFSMPDDSISFYLDADILFLRPFSNRPSIVLNGALPGTPSGMPTACAHGSLWDSAIVPVSCKEYNRSGVLGQGGNRLGIFGVVPGKKRPS